jgi:hypothetical protein
MIVIASEAKEDEPAAEMNEIAARGRVGKR